jgi:fructose-bisphosphate aldolase class II
VEQYPEIPICLHLDHGATPASCVSAIANGFTSVMMDGSLEADGRTVASYDYNVCVTREVVQIAHSAGVSVEGEIGVLGSLETGSGDMEDGHGFEGTLPAEQLLTDPDQAADFVAMTEVDALAVACGTSHGAYKFCREPDDEIHSMRTIAEIHRFP